MPKQVSTPYEDHVPQDLQPDELAGISPYTTGILKPTSWTPTNGLPSGWVPLNRTPGWTPINARPDLPLHSYESILDPVHGDGKMENARQYHEDTNGDPESDTAAQGKYFDYVSYVRHINATDADPAFVHDQFYTNVPPADYPLPQPATGLLSETHGSTEAGVQELIVQGTKPRLRMSAERYDVARDASSVITTDERCDRKRSPSQTSSKGESPAKKHQHVKGIFHPDEHDWLVLLHEKIKAAAQTGRHIKLSGPGPITRAFNSSFGGRILKDGSGQDLPPREDRMELSIRNKMMKPNTKIWELRDATRKLLHGKRGGEVYVPEISEEELQQYLADGTVSWHATHYQILYQISLCTRGTVASKFINSSA